MIDLGLNQNKIREIKYEIKENKIVTFKLFNSSLEDVTIEDTSKNQETAIRKENLIDKQYAIDKTIIDEHEAVEEKKVINNFNKLKKVDRERCKELMDALDSVPYKVYEKIGELHAFGKNEGVFINEEDPYVVNDERELPKVAKGLEEIRKKCEESQCNGKKDNECKQQIELTENEKSTLEASKEKDWKDSMKNDIITNPIIVTSNLDEKYKNLSTGEKREISKQIIDKDAKEDSKVIKERADNAIGDNKPLSDEVLEYPQKDFLKDKVLDLNEGDGFRKNE